MVISDENIKNAITILKKGGVVVFPTETSYGFAADAKNNHAVEKVMEIKGRELWKTPPLIVVNRQMADKYLSIGEKVKELVDEYWPGPLTVVGSIKEGGLLSDHVVRNGTIALRVSESDTAVKLSLGINGPIVATSANVSGKESCFSVDCVKKQLKLQQLQPDLYLNAGLLENKPASTIITEKNGEIVVLRSGNINVFGKNPNTLDRGTV